MKPYFPPKNSVSQTSTLPYVGSHHGRCKPPPAKSDKRQFRRGAYRVKNHFLVESSYLSLWEKYELKKGEKLAQERPEAV